MNSFVTALDGDQALPVQSVGGKVAALSILLRAGFPVPPGVCLTTAAFRLTITPYQVTINKLLHEHDLGDLASAAAASAQIIALLAESPLPDEVSCALFDALPLIATEKMAVAVRSSAIHEDSVTSSFAGQYSTILGVRGQGAIEEAVLDCWHSFFSAQALFERARTGEVEKEDGMAILIQPLVEAECAGVCFSVDPVAQKRERIVVNSAWGLGLGVVEGSVASDIDWLYRENFGIEKRHIVEKKAQVRLDASGQAQIAPVSQGYGRAACLPEAWLKRIGQFALALENLFGRPQEVEWAITSGQVWILQSRPITALPSNLAE